MDADKGNTRVNEVIRRVWPRLSEEEVRAREDYRDIFFLAVRKKHGIVRAQAQLFLNELEREYGHAV